MLFPPGDGDGWTRCAAGHRHWGIFGAAGLLLRYGDAVLLQHRALWSHHGGTWGILGGARNRGESAEQAAAREAGEEAASTRTTTGCSASPSTTTAAGATPRSSPGRRRNSSSPA